MGTNLNEVVREGRMLDARAELMCIIISHSFWFLTPSDCLYHYNQS